VRVNKDRNYSHKNDHSSRLRLLICCQLSV